MYSVGMNRAADGSLTSTADSVNGNWSYAYDKFNHLTGATASSGPFSGLALSWTYDRYGNRVSQSASGSYGGLVYQGGFNFVSNRISGYCYDEAGNLLDMQSCPAPGSNHQFTYDAEGRLVATTGYRYEYDAAGQRVAKDNSSGAVTSLYLRDGAGNQIAELNASLAAQHVNVYSGSHLIGTLDQTSGGVYYAYSDWLGTKRYEASGAGAYANSWASLPFGDNLTPQGSGLDATEQHFTGKERDTESGNDYFGARYYASSMGRMTSPDPSQLYYADPNNPQSFNLYAYVQNNPLVNVDPNGLDCVYFNDDQSVNHVLSGDCASTQDNGYYIDATGVNNATLNDNGDLTSYSTGDGSFLADGTPNNSSVEVTAPDPGIDPDEARINALVQGVATDTASMPWLCNTSVTLRGQIPKTPIAIGATLDRNGVSGSARARLGQDSGGNQVNITSNGKSANVQISVPTPFTALGLPVRATVGTAGANKVAVGASANIPWAKNVLNVSAALTFGYLGDKSCR